MRELQTGLWHWEAPHPEWGPGDSSLEWDRQEASSYAIDDGDRLLLFDPLALPSEIEELAAGRDTAIVLTCPWHEHDARAAWWSGSTLRCSYRSRRRTRSRGGSCSRPATGSRSGSKRSRGGAERSRALG